MSFALSLFFLSLFPFLSLSLPLFLFLFLNLFSFLSLSLFSIFPFLFLVSFLSLSLSPPFFLCLCLSLSLSFSLCLFFPSLSLSLSLYFPTSATKSAPTMPKCCACHAIQTLRNLRVVARRSRAAPAPDRRASRQRWWTSTWARQNPQRATVFRDFYSPAAGAIFSRALSYHLIFSIHASYISISFRA